MDADFFAFEDVTWQTVPPPARHPVPAAYVPDLDVGDELTIGLPNRYFIDGQVLLRPEREVVDFSDDGTLHESLAVCAPLHYWTWKASPSRNPVMQWWPVEYAWAYRDAGAPGESAPTALDAMDEQRSWLDRVRLDASQPPVLLPVPVREAGALTGRALRSRNPAGEWFWFVGVSEPVDVHGEICVQVVPSSHWWLHQVGYYSELQDKVRSVPLHRLFAYV
ncbi:hypothetical protein [Cellulomonas xylanilytica]|uniref:Uncharacterized protein n=1 Tax=Cellulomonas xylanilytica TaxID=233583 RepID=A0A510V7X5_9CELL|nr:hypothetical protein [Cellulomonas xylanilytica]GEK21370.1 hypothetical protein CXY01_18900 [Cellulomonas xylanilytica]